MPFTISVMTEKEANIIAEWTYEGIYSFYDTKADKEDYAELMNPNNWGNKYYSALDENGELIGYFEYEKKGDFIELGLAMSPSKVGMGKGEEFVNAGLKFLTTLYETQRVILSVAAFNKRAITVYERLGFTITNKYYLQCINDNVEFLRMELNKIIK